MNELTTIPAIRYRFYTSFPISREERYSILHIGIISELCLRHALAEN